MTESNDFGRVFAPAENNAPSSAGTDQEKARESCSARQIRLIAAKSTDERCLRDAELIARANDLPLPRVLAVALASAPIYQGKLNDLGCKISVPHEAIEAYKELVGAAEKLRSMSDYPDEYLDIISQVCEYHVGRMRRAIDDIALLWIKTNGCDPFYLELRRSMEAIAAFFAILYEDSNTYWCVDSGSFRRFFADVQRVCGSEVDEQHLIRCWGIVASEAVAIRPRMISVTLTENERTELDLWRAKHAADGPTPGGASWPTYRSTQPTADTIGNHHD